MFIDTRTQHHATKHARKKKIFRHSFTFHLPSFLFSSLPFHSAPSRSTRHPSAPSSSRWGLGRDVQEQFIGPGSYYNMPVFIRRDRERAKARKKASPRRVFHVPLLFLFPLYLAASTEPFHASIHSSILFIHSCIMNQSCHYSTLPSRVGECPSLTPSLARWCPSLTLSPVLRCVVLHCTALRCAAVLRCVPCRGVARCCAVLRLLCYAVLRCAVPRFRCGRTAASYSTAPHGSSLPRALQSRKSTSRPPTTRRSAGTRCMGMYALGKGRGGEGRESGAGWNVNERAAGVRAFLCETTASDCLLACLPQVKRRAGQGRAGPRERRTSRAASAIP